MAANPLLKLLLNSPPPPPPTLKITPAKKDATSISHQMVQFTDCPWCSYSTTVRLDLYRHIMKRHKPPRRFKCRFSGCASIFRHHDNLKSHHQTVHTKNKERPYTCPTCDKSFGHKYILDRHLQTHRSSSSSSSDEKNFSCPHCPYRSKESRDLLTHLSTSHTALLGPFKCDQCGFVCTTKENLADHTFHVHFQICGQILEQVHDCPHCPHKFALAEALKRHLEERHHETFTGGTEWVEEDLRTTDHHHHLGLKTLQCTFCPFITAHKAALLAHMKVHVCPSSSTRYPCPIEGCRFLATSFTLLRIHIEVHGNKGQFPPQSSQHQKSHTKNNSQQHFLCCDCECANMADGDDGSVVDLTKIRLPHPSEFAPF